jgi:glycosyltransferase involved in cell wall biosynthesis
MQKISISYKTKTKIIDNLCKDENISEIKNKSGLFSNFFSKDEYGDVYFHSGILDDESKEAILNSKKTIVNSQSMRYELAHRLEMDKENIEVIYPSLDIEYEKPKEVKQRVCEKLNLDSKKKIILFTAKNFKTSGVNEFVETVFSLNEDNFYALIAGDSKQITSLKFKMSKFLHSERLVFVEDYEKMDDLFLASDIFLLPTYNKSFSFNVLKAMFCKCAVFTTSNNSARELIDVYATIEGPSDRSTPFKLDALLMDSSELKKIKKQNRNVACEYTIEKNLQRLRAIISNI